MRNNLSETDVFSEDVFIYYNPTYEQSDENSKINVINLGKLKEKLRRIGVEVTNDGKIILYHATSLENFLQILECGEIRPPVLTGKIMRRGIGEEDGDKINKVYLAKFGSDALKKVRECHTGITCIIKVYIKHKDIGNLRIDEDCIQNIRSDFRDDIGDFVDSLNTHLGVCSYKGNLTEFELHSCKNFFFKNNIGFKIISYKYKFFKELLLEISQKSEFDYEKTMLTIKNALNGIEFEGINLIFNNNILTSLRDKGREYFIENNDSIRTKLEHELGKYSCSRIIGEYCKKNIKTIKSILEPEGVKIKDYIIKQFEKVLSILNKTQSKIEKKTK